MKNKLMMIAVAMMAAGTLMGCCACNGKRCACEPVSACACTDGKPCNCGDTCNCAKEKTCACDKSQPCTCCTDHAKCACKKPGCSCRK